MLFQLEQIGALAPLDFHSLRQLKEEGIQKATLELSHIDYEPNEIEEMTSLNNIQPIAVRLPEELHLGHELTEESQYVKIFSLLSQAFKNQVIYIILQTKPVAVGEVFDYFETKPGDFKALQDFKELWFEQVVQACRKLKEIAEAQGVQLLFENAPIGGKHYFEPGHDKIYPLFRTPHHLDELCTKTGMGLCFHTGNARISTNVLQYMKRSRSIFAAATEDEILRSPTDWIEFYQRINAHVKLVHLCDSISWGDTEEGNDIPFRTDQIPELLKFAQVFEDSSIPVVLHVRQKLKHQNQRSRVQHMLQMLKELRKG